MDVYVISINKTKRNTAGSKAPADVVEICRKQGYKVFDMPGFPRDKNLVYRKLWLLIVSFYYWRKLEKTVAKGSIVIYQHPMYGNRMAQKMIPRIQNKKQVKFIALIHDLESLRGGISGVTRVSEKTRNLSDTALLSQFDSIICHNEHMKQYLVSRGFDSSKLECLEIFDYLCDVKEHIRERGDNPSIAIAGNLAIGKCPYMYNISTKDYNKGLMINLYGINFDQDSSGGNIIYHGSFSPEELPVRLQGDFGLVWDGNSVETCSGNTGEYLKYNNPHKTSLYLASGLPVIVWNQAAIADFILQNHVGIAVDSLQDIEEKIKEISAEEYDEMCRNARNVGGKIRDGYYVKRAIEAAASSLA